MSSEGYSRIIHLMATLEFHAPSGAIEVKQPFAPRVSALAGRRVGFVSNDQWQAFRMLPLLKKLLEADFPGIEVLPIDAFPQGNAVIGSEETAALVKQSGVDAVIIGNAAWGSCATACGRAAARLEAQGIPTVTLTRADFVGVMTNAVAGLGLAPDAAMVTFPIEMFLPGSDISAVEARKREFYEGLTRWRSAIATDAAGEAPMIKVQAASIGRALRLLQQNVGGALPGIGTMANYGGVRYTNVVFAEDEPNLPPGWSPHATERHAFAPGQSSISLAFANGATNIRRRGAKKETPEEDALQGMYRMADFMRVPNMPGLAGYEHGTPGILMIPGVVANTMAGLGWTKV